MTRELSLESTLVVAAYPSRDRSERHAPVADGRELIAVEAYRMSTASLRAQDIRRLRRMAGLPGPVTRLLPAGARG